MEKTATINHQKEMKVYWGRFEKNQIDLLESLDYRETTQDN